MGLKVGDIKKGVRKILDYNNTINKVGGITIDADAQDVDTIIESQILPAARQVVLIAPKEWCIATEKDEAKGEKPVSGKNYIEVPFDDEYDFLRFGLAKVKSWAYPIGEPITTDCKEYHQQFCDWAGLKATPQKPVVAIVNGVGGDNNGNKVQLFGVSGDDDRLEYLTYIAAPLFSTTDVTDTTELNLFPYGLEQPLLYFCAAYTSEALKDTNKSNQLMQMAVNMLNTQELNQKNINNAND